VFSPLPEFPSDSVYLVRQGDGYDERDNDNVGSNQGGEEDNDVNANPDNNDESSNAGDDQGDSGDGASSSSNESSEDEDAIVEDGNLVNEEDRFLEVTIGGPKWLPRRAALQQERADLITDTFKLLECASLSFIYKLLLAKPHVMSNGEPEFVAMVMANTERRHDDSNVERLLLDSASTIHIATSKSGMTDL
jgi:hypothetical protein